MSLAEDPFDIEDKEILLSPSAQAASRRRGSDNSTPRSSKGLGAASSNWRSSSSGSSPPHAGALSSDEALLTLSALPPVTPGPKNISATNAQAIFPPSACVFVAKYVFLRIVPDHH
jgi:hypothetical protein